jgi:hypothetical protein
MRIMMFSYVTLEMTDEDFLGDDRFLSRDAIVMQSMVRLAVSRPGHGIGPRGIPRAVRDSVARETAKRNTLRRVDTDMK